MFEIGGMNRENIELILGNNITLVGRSKDDNGGEDNNNSIIKLEKGKLTMLNGSKITGNASTASSILEGGGAAVYLSDGNLTMKEGSSITGNKATFNSSSFTGVIVAGLCHGGSFYTTINMEGGSITGNTAMNGDVDINCNISLSGNATIGELKIISFDPNNSPLLRPVIVNSGWTGTIGKLNLEGGTTSITFYDMPATIACWVNNPVIKAASGYILQTSDVEKILSFGNFYSTSSYITPQAISEGYKIEKTGGDIGKLIAK